MFNFNSVYFDVECASFLDRNVTHDELKRWRYSSDAYWTKLLLSRYSLDTGLIQTWYRINTNSIQLTVRLPAIIIDHHQLPSRAFPRFPFVGYRDSRKRNFSSEIAMEKFVDNKTIHFFWRPWVSQQVPGFVLLRRPAVGRRFAGHAADTCALTLKLSTAMGRYKPVQIAIL